MPTKFLHSSITLEISTIEMETHAYITCPSSKIHAWIHVYANTYAHLAKSLWAFPLTMRFTEISTIQNSRNWIAMIARCVHEPCQIRANIISANCRDGKVANIEYGDGSSFDRDREVGKARIGKWPSIVCAWTMGIH